MEFDGYYEWLGIPRAEQPPNLYRLLGIQAFESDPAVIENAADRQMLFLRQFQIGPRSHCAAAMLREVSQAKLELLHPQRRLAYDAYLKQGLQQVGHTVIATSPASYGPPSLMAPVLPAPIAVPVMHTRAVNEGGTDVRSHYSPATRRPRKASNRSSTIRLVGIILGGPVGILIGLWLARVLLGVDLLSPSVPQRAPRADNVPRHQSRPTPVVVADSRSHTNGTVVPERSQTPVPTTPALPPAPREMRPLSVRPASAAVSPQVLPVVDSFPESVELPPRLNSEPVRLFPVAQATSDVEWSVRGEAADVPAGGLFVVRRAGEQLAAWSIFFAPNADDQPTAIAPIASFQLADGGFQFRWTAATGDEAIRDQLCNCHLEAKSAGQSQLIQLRKAKSVPAPKLNLNDKESQIVLELANPPSMANVFLELDPMDEGEFEDGAAQANLGKPIVFAFSELQGAQLTMRMQWKAEKGQFTIRYLPELVEGPKLKFELTRDKLEEMTKRWSDTLRKAGVAINLSQRRIALLQAQQSKLGGVSAENIAVMAERDRQLRAIQGQLKSELERLPTHRKRAAECQARLTAVPMVESFLSAHHNTDTIHFRVYAQVGADRLLLVQSQ